VITCAVTTSTGTVYARGVSWAVVRDWARARWGVRDDDVQHRPDGAPEGVEVTHVAGPMGHDERRVDEARGVRRAALREALDRMPIESNGRIQRYAIEDFRRWLEMEAGL
jgi:hypothetical protein